jgi:lipopolysaccharide transport system permease protein
VMMIWSGTMPGLAILALPVFMLLAVIAALAAGLWLSALAVEYRDIKYIIPFITQLGMYLSPVIYVATDLIPRRYWPVYFMNPMAGVIEGFRWALLGKAPPPLPWLMLSVLMTVIVFTGGLFYFRRMEKTFADLA